MNEYVSEAHVSVSKQGQLYDKELSAPRPIPKLEDRPLSAVRDCLFIIFTVTLHIGGRSSIHNLRMRHGLVTGTHLSWEGGGRNKIKNYVALWISTGKKVTCKGHAGLSRNARVRYPSLSLQGEYPKCSCSHIGVEISCHPEIKWSYFNKL